MAHINVEIASELQPFLCDCSIVLPQGFKNSPLLSSLVEKSSNFPYLRSFDGSRCFTFSDSDCKILGLKNMNLKHFILPNCAITAKGFEYLIRLPQIQSLDVQKNHFGPDAAKFIGAISSITDLKIGGCGIGDTSIMILAKNTVLR